MPKPYEAKTLDKFGGLNVSGGTAPNHTAYSNADLKDGEASVLKNFIFNSTGGLSKRHSVQVQNSAVAPTISIPSGQALTAPANIRPLGIQRLSSAVNDRLYFTDQNKTNLWWTELTAAVNSTTRIVRTPGPTSYNGIQWMISTATPANPFQVMFCRTGGGIFECDQNGVGGGVVASTNGTHMTLFKDRVFMCNSLGTTSDESKLYYSDETNYVSWGANSSNIVGPSQNDYMVATIVFNDTLIIFKSRSTWVVVVEGAPPAWVYRNLHPTIGCAGRGTPRVIAGMVYFLSNDGIYRTDGTSFEKISTPVDQLLNFDTANPQSVLLRDAWYYNDKYIIKNDVGTTVLVYDTIHDAWTQWEFAGGVNVQNAMPYSDVASPWFYMGDATTPKIYRLGVESGATPWMDNGANYTCSWLSKRQTWDDPVNYKRNYMFAMDVGHSNVSGTQPEVTITHKTDSNELGPPYVLTTIPVDPANESGDLAELTRRELKLPGAGYGRAIETRIDYVGPTAFELYSVTWLNAVKDTIKKSN